MQINNNNSTLIGRMTFFKLIKDYHIQIPILQRDYAQGRNSAAEVRTNFLDSLYIYLDENIKHRDLDFIYGNQLQGAVDGYKTFVPLDGQQRLTTLFLLHWYLALKEGEVNLFRNHMTYSVNNGEIKSKFTYETRISSKEFCDSLVANDINLDSLLPPDDGKNNQLSKTIRDSTWFFLTWEMDPTIQSMLVMLDAIHEKFKETKGFFQRLVSEDNPVITFQFLDLEQYNLSDDLYIKMNARGKPLSPFENFKAKLEQFILKSDFNNKYKYTLISQGKNKSIDVKTYFSFKIDTKWANLFWKYTDNKHQVYDDFIMNYIRAIIINNYAATIGSPEYKSVFLVNLIHRKDESISFKQYLDHNCLTEKNILDVITLLDLQENGDNKVRKYLTNSSHYQEEDQFEWVIKNDSAYAEYVKRILLHAYSQYLIKWTTPKGFVDTEGLHVWMRVIFNLTHATEPYNNETEFANSIHAINQLLKYSNDILNHIISLGSLRGFDDEQLKEEKIKANLLLRKSQWEELVYPIENHGYFKGQIGFLLFLSGIEDYYNQHNNCNWDNEEDSVYKEKFIRYKDIAEKIFTNNGLVPFDNFLWERALLTQGDYRIAEERNQSFLINIDRDISWKRFLKRDKNRALHNQIISDVFNKIGSPDNVKEYLQEVIDDSNVNDWRTKFIENHNLFNYLGEKRYVRKDSPHGFVLLKGIRMSGYHVELYTYDLFLREIKDKEFKPFRKPGEYYFAAGDGQETPCAFIDEWNFENIHYALDIYYASMKEKFKLRFFYRHEGHYANSLIDVISALGFTAENNSYIKLVNENEVLNSINNLCQKLIQLEQQ